MRVVTEGLQFPEGPICLEDGSFIVVEIRRQSLTRISADGRQSVHVGATDLCDAMAIPGQFGNPRLETSFQKVIVACRRHNKFAGAGERSGADAKNVTPGRAFYNCRQRMGVYGRGSAPTCCGRYRCNDL
jgi:2-keto-3-deoxy-L-rhamnonate aldolase RhmA